MTREECLEYRKECPYDAMGDYSVLIEKDRTGAAEPESSFQAEAPAEK